MVKRELEAMLYSYPYAKIENRNIELELERMEITGLKNITYDFKPKSHSKGSIVENEVLVREEDRKLLEAKYRRNKILIEKIDNSFEILNEYEKQIITKYYFKRNLLKDIAQQMYLTHIYISMLKKTGLEKLLEVLN